MKTLALIPAHNEAETLPAMIAELGRHHDPRHILVIDDASSDGSADLVPGLGVRWLELAQHLGVGGAIRAGLRFARHCGYECAVRLDADGQHPPGELGSLLEPLRAGEADATVGSRFAGATNSSTSPHRRLVIRLLAFFLSRACGHRVTDPTSGFWAFGPRALRLLGDHYPRGYSEPELRLFLHRNGLRVVEVPVQMRERMGGRSTLTLPRATLAVARATLAMLVVPLRRSEEPG